MTLFNISLHININHEEKINMKIKCPLCGYENYFTGLEDEGTIFCCNCNNNKPLVKSKIPEATEKPDKASLGLHNEAIEACKQAIRINPNNATAYDKLGLAYYNLGLYNDAIEAYKQAIRIDPDLVTAYLILSCSYFQIGDKNSALNVYKILKDINIDAANSLFDLINK